MYTHITDLSHLINAQISVYPGMELPSLTPRFTVARDGFAEMQLQMLTHTATHMDAPYHILEGRKSLDEFGVDKFTGNACVINCSTEKEIGIDFLNAHKELISQAEFIILYTGWHTRWGTDSYLAPYPTLSQDACRWLLDFKLKGIGLDVISVDAIDSVKLENHHILLANDMVIIENLNNVDRLPFDTVFQLFAFPLKLEKADGSPIRAVAMW